MCYDCNRKSKRELENENKTSVFYVCLASLSVGKKNNNKERESISYYGCIIQINFFFLSHSSSFALVCFVYSLWTYLRWRIPFDTMI